MLQVAQPGVLQVVLVHVCWDVSWKPGMHMVQDAFVLLDRALEQ